MSSWTWGLAHALCVQTSWGRGAHHVHHTAYNVQQKNMCERVKKSDVNVIRAAIISMKEDDHHANTLTRVWKCFRKTKGDSGLLYAE